MRENLRYAIRSGIIGISALALAGCSNLPGTPGEQGAVIGGTSGAAAGAAIAHNHALGAIIGGAVGAAGGYVVGANKDKITGKDNRSAAEAERNSQENPATPAQALNSSTADLNNDGFVTLDEVTAMKQAGLTDEQMIQRLQTTGQVFNLTPDQQRYLSDRGVSQSVISQMLAMNRQSVPLNTAPPGSVISQPSPTSPRL